MRARRHGHRHNHAGFPDRNFLVLLSAFRIGAPPGAYNPPMRRSRKRLLLLALGLLPTVVASTLLYMWGMAALEGKPRDFWQSLEWAGRR